MKPKRCTSLWPFTGPIPSGNRRRCTLEAGHTGNHTIIPPSGMDYAPDDGPGFTMDDGVSYCDRHHRFDCTGCVKIAAQIKVLEELLAGQDGHWIVRASAKIAALRKELEK